MADKKETVAVLLPVYRESAIVVERAIDSIAHQTYGAIELVVVADDPSNIGLIDQISKKLEKMRIEQRLLVNEENLGLARSLNGALRLVHSSYVCRMDADDYAHPDRIERQLAYLKENNLDLVGCYMNVVSDSGALIYREDRLPVSPEAVSRSLPYKNCVMHPTWFGRREVFELEYRSVPYAEDLDFLMRAQLRGYKVGNCPEILFDYHLSEGSISRTNQLKQFLVQLILSENYINKKIVSLEDLTVELREKWSSEEDFRYSRAVADLNQCLGSASLGESVLLLPKIFCHFISQRYFRKKILYNLATIAISRI